MQGTFGAACLGGLETVGTAVELDLHCRVQARGFQDAGTEGGAIDASMPRGELEHGGAGLGVVAQHGEKARETELVRLDAGRGVAAQDAHLDAVVDAVERGGNDHWLLLVAPSGGYLEGVADGVVGDVQAAGDREAVDTGAARGSFGMRGGGGRAEAAVGVGDKR